MAVCILEGKRRTAKEKLILPAKIFVNPQRFFYNIQRKYADRLEISYEIFKDKYWRIFNRFNQI